ncbi:MAG: HEPN domain-containing protein [Propionibacteriaceae bacterium]|jgi:hypothetical protein|nr:HEPN domain-containing protein [Propionibacteriaceae bacterium]
MSPSQRRHRQPKTPDDDSPQTEIPVWDPNRSGIDYLVEQNRLSRVPTNQEHAQRLLSQAETNVLSARTIHGTGTNPAGAFTLCYDASRMALTAVLAAQGLRPMEGRGSHLVIEDALRPQFPQNKQTINRFTWLRETRHTVEYPDFDSPSVTDDDVTLALEYTDEIISLAHRFLLQHTRS